MTTETFADDTPVNAGELARAMRVSRWTVQNWKSAGYRFEFGRLATAGHCKAWLRAHWLTRHRRPVRLAEKRH